MRQEELGFSFNFLVTSRWLDSKYHSHNQHTTSPQDHTLLKRSGPNGEKKKKKKKKTRKNTSACILTTSKVSMFRKKVITFFFLFLLQTWLVTVKVVDIILQQFEEKGREHRGCGKPNNDLSYQTKLLFTCHLTTNYFFYLHLQTKLSSYLSSHGQIKKLENNITFFMATIGFKHYFQNSLFILQTFSRQVLFST